MTKKRKYTRTKTNLNKRSRIKHPYLHPGMNIRKRKEYMDNIEYVNGVKNNKGEEVIRKMNEEEKEWLNQFNKEFYGASIPSKKDIEGHEHSLHDTEDNEVRKEIWLGNNARNRCLYNNLNCRGMLIDLDIDAYDKFMMEVFDRKGLSSEEAIKLQYDIWDEED